MKEAIKEYSDAVQENIEASRLETVAKARKQQAYYRLQKARDNLRAVERELLSDNLVLN